MSPSLRHNAHRVRHPPWAPHPTHLQRPIRLSLALAVTPVFNAGLDTLQRRTGWNKGVVYGFILAGIAVGTLSLLFTILLVAGGFPQGLPAFLAGQR